MARFVGGERWFVAFGRALSVLRTPLFTIELRPTRRPTKSCSVCGGPHGDGFPDPCLGELPGVVGACCGHGDRGEAFIGWKGGLVVRGFWIDQKTRREVARYYEEQEQVPVTLHIPRTYLDGDVDSDVLRELGEFAVEGARYEAGERCPT